MMDQNETPVKATATSVRVIDALIQLEGGTVTELEDHLNLSKSSIHNHLETLEILGFAVRDGWRYRVSLRFLQIGGIACRQHPLYDIGLPIVRQLATSSGLVASLVVVERSEAICLFSSTGTKAEYTFPEVGDTLPLHSTAPGKALLAAMPAERVDSVLDTSSLDAETENTLTSREALEEEFQKISSRGLAFDREEWRIGVRGIATTILDTDGDLIGAICVTSSVDSMSGKRFQQDIPGMVISSANKIRKALRKT